MRIAACTETSSAEVGSSQTTMRGSPANARAIATRCLRPPESCAGLAPRSDSSKRTDSASSRDALVPRPSPCSAEELVERAADDAPHGEAAVERRSRGSGRRSGARAPAPSSRFGDACRRAARRRARASSPRPARVRPSRTPRERRLAAARLADEAERLAGAHDEGDVDERVDVLALLVERLRHVLDLEERLAVRRAARQRQPRRARCAAARAPRSWKWQRLARPWPSA